MLIYIVEDEERIRELESYALEKNDFEVMSFENSVEFKLYPRNCTRNL